MQACDSEGVVAAAASSEPESQRCTSGAIEDHERTRPRAPNPQSLGRTAG
jgi:hypothetical protein